MLKPEMSKLDATQKLPTHIRYVSLLLEKCERIHEWILYSFLIYIVYYGFLLHIHTILRLFIRRTLVLLLVFRC